MKYVNKTNHTNRGKIKGIKERDADNTDTHFQKIYTMVFENSCQFFWLFAYMFSISEALGTSHQSNKRVAKP